MKKLSAMFAVVVMGLAGVARAEPQAAPAPVEYGFDDELVHGDLMRPDTEVVHVRRRNMHASLVEVRFTYLPELLKSVEDL